MGRTEEERSERGGVGMGVGWEERGHRRWSEEEVGEDNGENDDWY